MTRNTLFAGMLFGISAGVFASSATAAPNTGAKQAAATPYVPGELLVTFKQSALAGNQAARVNSLSKGKVIKTLHRFRTQKVKLPPDVSIAQAIKTYQGQSAVVSVQPNYRYYKLANGSQGHSATNSASVFRFGANATAQAKTPKAPKPPKGKTPNDREYKAQWDMKKIQAPVAWGVDPQGQGNANVVVAVIDTGINYQHEDLAQNMWRNPSEVPGNGADDDGNGYVDDYYGIDTTDGDSDPRDIDGHGTHVAGVIGAVGNNKRGIAGLNWRVKLMALRVLGEEGGTTEGIVEAMNYMLDMKASGVNIRVANHSYGAELPSGTPFDPLEKTALDTAAGAGILSAIAAGNGGFDGVGDDNNVTPHFPSGYSSPGSISVAATDRDDRLSRFSNYGTGSVDLAAPGVDIISTYPYEFIKVRPAPGATPTPSATPGATPVPGGAVLVQVPSNKGYKLLSGTSMAAPHVAGAAAMIFGFGEYTNRNFTVQQVRNFILNGADKLPQLKGKLKTGDRQDPNDPASTTNGGRLNVAVSLTLAGAATGYPGPTPVPTATPDPFATPTPIPTATPIPIQTLPNGNIVHTQFVITGNTGLFPTINQMGPNGGSTVLIPSEVRDLQNPYISLKTGRVAFVVDLANVTGEQLAFVDQFGEYGTRSAPEQEIFVRDTNGTITRLTDDEANGIPPVDDREPAISPDGTRIVFVKRDANGNDQLYIMSASRKNNGTPPDQFLLLGDNGTTVSSERRPAWTPDGTRIVFHSNRPLSANDTSVKDNDIYMLTVPTTLPTTPSTTPLLTQANLVRLTLNPGDDIEPTVGPTIAETQVARPNGQLAYASNRNDANNIEPRTVTIFRTRQLFGTGAPLQQPVETTYDTGEDYDIYLQNLAVENNPANRPIRIVDTPREVVQVLGFTGDYGAVDVNPNDDAGPNDDYLVDLSVSGDDRRPTFSPNGQSVVFCSDSDFFAPFPGNAPKNFNPDSDFDVVRVDINSRGFTRLTTDQPTRSYVARTDALLDQGSLNVTEDYEPIAGAQVGTTAPPVTPTPPGPPTGPPTGAVRDANGADQGDTASNHAPVATDDSLTTYKDTPLEIALKATDADGDALIYQIGHDPAHGKLSGNGPNVIYTPNRGFVGTDKFVFRASDGKASSNVATITIKVVESGKADSSVRYNAASASSVIARPDENSVEIRFDKPLNPAPTASSFVVLVNNHIVEVLDGDYSAASNTLTLELADGVLQPGDKVTVLRKP